MTASKVSPVRISSPPITHGISRRSALSSAMRPSQLGALGRAGRVVADGLVRGRRRSEESGAAHRRDSTIPGHGRAGRLRGRRLGRGGAVALDGPVLAWHELPCAAAAVRRHAPARRAGARVPLAARATPSRTSSSTSTGARRSSGGAWRRCARSRTARRRRYGEVAALAGHPNAQRAVGLGLRGEPLRAVRAVPPRGRRPTGSARTARSGRSTSGGCWSSRVSFSEDVRSRAGAGSRRSASATGSRSSRRSSTSPAGCTCSAAARSRCTSISPARRSRGGRSRCCARSASAPRSAPTAGGRSGGRRATSSTSRRAGARSRCSGRRRRRRAASRRATGRRGACVGRALLPARRTCAARCSRPGSVSAPPSPHLEVRSESREGAEAVADGRGRRGRRAARRRSARDHVGRLREGNRPDRRRARGGGRERGGARAAGARGGRLHARAANRLANADHANLVRTSRAAHVQLEAVRRLERSGRLDELSPQLREIARAPAEAPVAVAPRAGREMRSAGDASPSAQRRLQTADPLVPAVTGAGR